MNNTSTLFYAMNDFEYDVLQRKRLAYNSRKKKNGSKSKRCSLPSDNITNKQWKERCGSIVSYNLRSPMDWKEFKSLPDGAQSVYIKSLIDKYNVNLSSLSEMFNVDRKTVRNVVSSRLGIEFHVGHSMTDAQRNAWSKFLSLENDEKFDNELEVKDEDVIIIPENDDCKAVEDLIPIKSEIAKRKEMSMNEVCLKFSGAINVYSISNSLRMILGDNSEGDIEIKCSLW